MRGKQNFKNDTVLLGVYLFFFFFHIDTNDEDKIRLVVLR